MSPATVPLVLLAQADVISIFRSLVRRQRPKVSFLVELLIEFIFVGGVGLDAILRLRYLISLRADQLTVL